MVTASRDECMKYFPSLIVSRSVNNNRPSGRVVLLTTVLKDISDNGKTWTEDDYRIIKKRNPTSLLRIHIMIPVVFMLHLVIKGVFQHWQSRQLDSMQINGHRQRIRKFT